MSPLECLDRHGPYMAIAKPAGRVVHGRDGLLEQLRSEQGPQWELVHRLDRETSGVLLFADSKAALRRAVEAWRSAVRKRYLALALDLPPDDGGEISEPILEHRTAKPQLLRRALRAAYGDAIAERLLAGSSEPDIPPLPLPGRATLHPAGRPASTRWRVRGRTGRIALVELEPEHGRMHQLRIHLRAVGGGIVGDRWYGAGEVTAPRLMLHLLELRWVGGDIAGDWVWQAPLPADWDAERSAAQPE